jgi:uncharacterized protein (TIGR02147 family)
VKIGSTIYEAKSYRDYLLKALASPRYGRGARTRLAEHLGAQGSFVSIVLSGRQDFSPEHGLRIAEFFELDESETEYLILLIERERAGSEKLRRHYQRALDRVLKARNEIQHRVKANAKDLSEVDLAEYYGAWYHIAVHMALRNTEIRDLDAVADTLGIRRADAKKSVVLLERLGFVRVEKGRMTVTDQRFHVSEKTASLRAHHANWRQAAVRSLDEMGENDLHYSLVMSIDDASFAKIRAILLAAIENADPHIRDARDRKVCALNIDLFELHPKS